MKINAGITMEIGDIVEIKYPQGHNHAAWNGFQFLIKKLGKYTINGVITKTVPGKEAIYPVGRNVPWGDPSALVVVAPAGIFPAGIFDEEPVPCSRVAPVLVALIKLSDIDKIRLGDIVEIQYAGSPTWNGIQFRVTEHDQFYYKGIIVKTTEKQAKSRPVGSEFTWSCSRGLAVIPEEPSPNQVYIDHIYGRLTQTANTEELMRLAERIIIHANKQL